MNQLIFIRQKIVLRYLKTKATSFIYFMRFYETSPDEPACPVGRSGRVPSDQKREIPPEADRYKQMKQ